MNISSKQSSKTKGNFLLLSSFFKLNNKKFRGGIFYVVFIYLDYNVSSSPFLTMNFEFTRTLDQPFEFTLNLRQGPELDKMIVLDTPVETQDQNVD